MVTSDLHNTRISSRKCPLQSLGNLVAEPLGHGFALVPTLHEDLLHLHDDPRPNPHYLQGCLVPHCQVQQR